MSEFVKNYHWRSLDMSKWAKQWFEENLIGLEADGVKVETLAELEGDCELGMRKAKLITIYDLRITSHWSGHASTGTLTAVEVAHDMDESDYVFESTLNSGGKSEAESKAKKALANKMRAVFQRFPKAMVDENGPAFYAKTGAPQPGSEASSGTSTPHAKSGPTVAPAGAATAPVTSSSKGVSTSLVRAEGEFQVSADDLWSLLTDETKIPSWSRNPAKMKPEQGAEVSLFGGNITGKVLEAAAPTLLVTTWRAPTWPEDHFGKLKTTLRQGDNSTTLKLELTGVPVSALDETERNLDIFYIRSLKQIGSAVSPPNFRRLPRPLSPASERTRRERSESPPDFPTPAVPPNKVTLFITGAVPMILSLGMIAALAYGIWKGPTGDAWRQGQGGVRADAAG